MQVVLQVGDQRLFTPFFQDQLQRDLQNQLGRSLGLPVEVRRSHPLLREIQDKGAGAGLATFHAVSEERLQFVFVDYEAGEYRVRVAHHDGWTGLAGSQILEERTPLRSALAALAVGLVEADYRPVGTIVAVDQDSADVRFHGLPAGTALSRWVKPGGVLAISQIQEGATRVGRRMPWAVLEVKEIREGVAKCRFWRRYQEQTLKADGTTRVAVLPTRNGPVGVRLVDAEGRALQGVHVRFVSTDQKKKSDAVTNREGLAASPGTLPHLALVEVLVQDQLRVRFPLEVLDRPAVACVVHLGDTDDRLANLEYRRDAWLRRLYDNHEAGRSRSATMRKFLERSLVEAVQAGQEGQTHLAKELVDLVVEKDYLLAEARNQKLSAKTFDLSEGLQRLQELQIREKQMSEWLASVRKVAQESDAGGLIQMVEKARFLERSGEIDAALEQYNRVLTASAEQKSVRGHVEELRKRWTPRDANHAAARKWLTQTWPALAWNEIGPNLAEAKKLFAVCRSHGDRLGVIPFAKANTAHAADLQKKLEPLVSQNSEDARSKAETIRRTANALRDLHAEVLEFLIPKKE